MVDYMCLQQNRLCLACAVVVLEVSSLAVYHICLALQRGKNRYLRNYKVREVASLWMDGLTSALTAWMILAHCAQSDQAPVVQHGNAAPPRHALLHLQ